MKSIVGYISCIIIALIYTLIWDGRCGIIILYVLVIAPILSIVMTLIAKSKVEISISSSTNMLHKGETVILSVALSKSVFIPIPYIKVSLFNAGNFTTESTQYILSLGMKNPVIINQNLTATIWGTARIGIQEVTISDYLGLVKFTLYKEGGINHYTQMIEIYPRIPDAPEPNDLIQTICNTVAYEDNEETRDSVTAIRGFPGYEHREYHPGDPIKSINWKLSIKRDVLMVRLDEEIINSKQVLILDRCNNRTNSQLSHENMQQLIRDEIIVEAVLAYLILLVKNGVESIFYFFAGGIWTRVEVLNEIDISTLQFLLAKFQFQVQNDRFNISRIPIDMIEEQNKVNAITMFTSSFDEGLNNQLKNLEQKGMIVHIVVTEPTIPTGEELWLVNNSFEFKRI